jgi:hypothetical protein
MNKIILSSFLLTFSICLKAQSAIVATGGDFSSSAGSVSYSIGQVVYTSLPNTNTHGSISQGVQQTYQVTTTGVLLADADFSLSVFPNPTTNQITLEVGRYANQLLNYVLVDTEGKQIQSNKVLDKQTNIDMSLLPTASYMMEVYQDNKKVQSFKILKLN